MTQVEKARKILEARCAQMMIVFEKDVEAGRRDARAGFYDKWYKNHRADNGEAYTAGWHEVYDTKADPIVRFIEG